MWFDHNHRLNMERANRINKECTESEWWRVHTLSVEQAPRIKLQTQLCALQGNSFYILWTRRLENIAFPFAYYLKSNLKPNAMEITERAWLDKHRGGTGGEREGDDDFVGRFEFLNGNRDYFGVGWQRSGEWSKIAGEHTAVTSLNWVYRLLCLNETQN